MPSTNQNAPKSNLHHSKHTHPTYADFDLYIHTIGNTMRESMVVLDSDLRVHSVNRAFCDLFQIDAASVKGRDCYELGNGVLNTPDFHRLLEEVLVSVTAVDDFEVTHNLPSGGVRTLLINTRVIMRDNRSRFTILVIAESNKPSSASAATWQNQSLLALLVESAPVALAIFDTEMRYLVASRRWISDYRLSEDNLYGRCHYDLLPDMNSDQWKQAHRRGLAGESFHIDEDRFARPDGSVSRLRWETRPWFKADSTVGGIVVFAEDITNKVQWEKTLHAVRSELANEVRGLSRLNEASSVLWRTRDLSEGLLEILKATIDILSADFGTIQLLDPDRQVLTIAAQQGFGPDFLDMFREVGITDACACGRALLVQQGLSVEDIEVDKEYAPFREIAHKSNYRAVQSTPLLSPQGQPLGMISTYWRLPHRPTQQELARLDLFARQAAEFIWRGRMDQQLHEHEAFVNSILDTAADAIITLNGQSVIVRVNAATEKMFGYTAPELLGREISILMPAVTSQEIGAILNQHTTLKPQLTNDNKREFLGMRKCGRSFPLELSVSEVDHLKVYTLIVRDITDRCRLQREIVTIAEDEQRKIGQELHDSAQQELTAVSLLARFLVDSLKGNSGDIPHAILNRCADIAEKIVSGVKRANEEVRQISHGLIPAQLDSKDLVIALQQLASQTDGLKSIACTFSNHTPIKIAETFTATHLFKIAQEAVTNCLKHAHAKHIRIELEAEESAIVLRVADDGVGYNEQPTRGVGLRSMEYRAHLINGILKLTNLDPHGSLLTCTVFNGVSTHVDASESSE